jgi:hypothetical protein
MLIRNTITLISFLHLINALENGNDFELSVISSSKKKTQIVQAKQKSHGTLWLQTITSCRPELWHTVLEVGN